MNKSYKAEVVADSTGKWCSNALRFATEWEAKEYGADLRWRWTSVTEVRVVGSPDAPRNRWANGKVSALEA